MLFCSRVFSLITEIRRNLSLFSACFVLKLSSLCWAAAALCTLPSGWGHPDLWRLPSQQCCLQRSSRTDLCFQVKRSLAQSLQISRARRWLYESRASLSEHTEIISTTSEAKPLEELSGYSAASQKYSDFTRVADADVASFCLQQVREMFFPCYSEVRLGHASTCWPLSFMRTEISAFFPMKCSWIVGKTFLLRSQNGTLSPTLVWSWTGRLSLQKDICSRRLEHRSQMDTPPNASCEPLSRSWCGPTSCLCPGCLLTLSSAQSSSRGNNTQLLCCVTVMSRLGVILCFYEIKLWGEKGSCWSFQLKDKRLFLDQRWWRRGVRFLKANNEPNNQSPNDRLGFIYLTEPRAYHIPPSVANHWLRNNILARDGNCLPSDGLLELCMVRKQ